MYYQQNSAILASESNLIPPEDSQLSDAPLDPNHYVMITAQTSAPDRQSINVIGALTN
ncbi:MAG: hypothetical protein K0R12_1278 [Gammaproteobacteria bacterium]|jgi:hypothetical protein|nr:hypothetical protein [Gammaproteobacteria bacterium]